MFFINKKIRKSFKGNSLCRQFVEVSPDAIVITSADGTVLAGNSKAGELFGYKDRGEVPTEVFGNYRNAADRDKMISILSEQGSIQEYEAELLDSNKIPFIASINVSVIDLEGESVYVATVRDISDRRNAEARVRLDKIRFEALSSLSKMVGETLNDIYDFVLEAGVRVTQSELGYIYFLSEDESELKLYAWSRDVMPQCSVKFIPDTYLVEHTGIWGDAVRERRPVITNDYVNHKGRRGLPEGHVPVRRHMNVPIFEDGRIVLLAGVGNKEDEYTQEDIRQLTLLMEGMWNIVRRKQADEALQYAYSEMEKQVQDRTEDLQFALANLKQINSEIESEVERRRNLEKRLRQFEMLIAVTPDLVSLVDSEYHYVMVNDSFVRSFNKPKDFFIGNHIAKVIGREVFEKHSKSMIDAALSGGTINFESWLDLPGLGRRYFSLTYHPVDSTVDDGKLVSITAHDITALKLVEEDRQNVFDVSPDLLCVFDFEGRFVEINPAWTKTLGWSPEELKNRDILDFVHPDDLEKSERSRGEVIKGKPLLNFENRYMCKDGSWRWLSWSSRADRGRRKVIAVARDVTVQKKMVDDLMKMASTDPLTGANNRRCFMDRAVDELDRIKRYGGQLCLMMMDIDHFKIINDTYGHDIGDVVIKELVKCSLATLRTSDVFGRIGGEEFAALLIQGNAESAMLAAERLRAAVENLEVKVGEHVIKFTVSIGLTWIKDGELSINEAFKQADTCMYKAKDDGRNRVVARC